MTANTNTTAATTMGDRIRIRRLSLKMSQSQLASDVGISAAAVSQWENGFTKGLKPENLLATADILETSIRWLVSGKDKKEKTDYLVKDSADYLLSKDEKNLILCLRTLSKESQLSLFALLQSFCH